MTISNSDRTAGPFIGNGVTTAYPFSFKVFARGDLLVARTDASGNEKILTLDADYSVTLNSNQSTTPGGTVTLSAPLAVGFTLAMTSNIALVQSLDLTNNGGFYPDQINGSLDRIVVMIQQVAAKVGGSLNVGGAAAIQTIGKLATAVGSSLVVFSNGGTPISIEKALDVLYYGSVYSWNPRYAGGVQADGVKDNSAALTAAIAALPYGRGEVLLPPGKPGILIKSQITIPEGVTLRGAAGSNGYFETIHRPSRLVAGTAGMTMLYTSSNGITLRDLAVDGAGIAKKCFHADGSAKALAFHHYENCDFVNTTDYCMHLQSCGLVRAHNLQAAIGLKAAIFLDGYCGDSDWSNIYVNTNGVDTTSTAFDQIGVGVWIGNGSNNLNWRGGKIEYNRIGMVIADSQGINITGTQFDVNRRYALAIIGNAEPPDGTDDPLTARSITITSCRFLGGEPRTHTNTAHIFGQFSRGVSVVGNSFRKGCDRAYDYNTNGAATPGPYFGIQLNGAERWVINGNDLQGAGTQACLKFYHNTPSAAQHVIGSNKLDGTQDVSDAYIANTRLYGSQYFAGTWQFPVFYGSFATWFDQNGVMRRKDSNIGMPADQYDGQVIGSQV